MKQVRRIRKTAQENRLVRARLEAAPGTLRHRSRALVDVGVKYG